MLGVIKQSVVAMIAVTPKKMKKKILNDIFPVTGLSFMAGQHRKLEVSEQ